MSDRKYANLPGIAYDEPDVYETSDLPEAEQEEDHVDDNDAVERLHISVDGAFEKFSSNIVLASGVDFSDKIGYGRRTGYDTRSGVWEIAGEGEKETLTQKYNRLQCEVQELMDEVAQVKGSVKDDSKQEELSSAEVGRQVELLQKTLLDVKLEEVLGIDVLQALSDPQGLLQKKLLTELESFKSMGKQSEGSKKETKKSSKDSASSDRVTYELFYQPEQAKFLQGNRLSALDERLQKLESVVGDHPKKMSSLSSETNHKSLLSAVSVLTARSSLLDPAQLDHVEGRLMVVNQKLNSAVEKQTTNQAEEINAKVNDLFNLVEQTRANCSSLPDIVERMSALQVLHEQALQFSKALSQLDNTQQQMCANLQNNEHVLKELQENFTQNISAIQANMASLDSRVANLKK